MQPQSTMSDDPRIARSIEVATAIGARPNRCYHNACKGADYLFDSGEYELDVALGFIVSAQANYISVIEHAWITLADTVIDPTLPFLGDRSPTYFQGTIDMFWRNYPDLRNRQYKAAFLAAKHLAATCDYENMSTHTRRIHIGRMNWVVGLDVAEGRLSR